MRNIVLFLLILIIPSMSYAADSKISALDAITAPTTSDYLPIVNDDDTSNKKITTGNLLGVANDLDSSGDVANDSHDHTSTTVSGLDISADTNLTAGDHITLTNDDLDVDDDFLLNTGDTGTGAYIFQDGDFSIDTTLLFVDVSTARVGIGTSTPSTNLEIYSTSDPTLTFGNDGDDGVIHWETSGDYFSLEGADLGWIVIDPSDTDNWVGTFYDNTNNRGIVQAWDSNRSGAEDLMLGNHTVNQLFLDSGGNVGIGTTAPTATLDVVGNVEINGSTVIAGDLSIGTGYDFVIGANDVTDANDYIDGDYVSLDSLTVSTYTTFQEFINTTHSAGWISGGEFSDNGDGSLSVAVGNGLFKTTDSVWGTTVFGNWSADTNVSLTDNDTNTIYVDYNSGTPSINATVTPGATIDHTTQHTLGVVYRDGTTLHMLRGGAIINNIPRRVHRHFKEDEGNHRTSGMVTAEAGTREITITEGVAYAGLNRFTTDAFDSQTTDFTYYYNDGAWQTSATGTIDNTQYNDYGTGLATLTAQRYGVHWVFMHFDSDVYVVYGVGNYTISQAEDVNLPANLPDIINDFSIPIAKIIIQKSGASFTAIETPFEESFSKSIVDDHNDLGNLDGGEATFYGHNTIAVNAWMTANTLGSDGSLAIGTEVLFADATNERVGIGTSTPAHKVDIIGDLAISTALFIPYSATPTVDAEGSLALDMSLTDPENMGLPVIYDGTQQLYIIATTDTPGDNEIPKYDDATGLITFEADAGAGGSAGFSWSPKILSAKLSSDDPPAIDAGTRAWKVLYDGSSIETATWQTVLRPYDGGTLQGEIIYSMASASDVGATVEWDIGIDCWTPNTDSLSIETASWGTLDELTDTVLSGQHRPHSIADSSLNEDSCAEGDWVNLQIFPDVDNNATAGDLELLGVTIWE